MKECERIGDLFGELHDNALDGEPAKAAREHLRNCLGCREEFKWYGITVHALAELERVEPPNDFLHQLHSRLYAPSPTQSFFDSLRGIFTTFPYLPLPVGVTALVFVGAVAFAVYNYAPSGVMPPSMASSATFQTPGGGTVDKADMRTVPAMTPEATGWKPDRVLTRTFPSSSGPSDTPSAFPAGTSKSIKPNLQTDPLMPSMVRVGSDYLTVESSSIDQAVQSLKRVLPNFQGKLVEEQRGNSVGEAVLQVAIPPQSWPHLTTELVNHGAVEVGPSESQAAQGPDSQQGNNVLIRIRIVHTR